MWDMVMFKRLKRGKRKIMGSPFYSVTVEHPCTTRAHQIVERVAFFSPPIGPIPPFLNYTVRLSAFFIP
jgi:hypothetical protein